MNGATGSTDGFAERPDIAFASAPAAMVVADRAGGVTLTNRAFADFTGQDPGGVLGRPWPRSSRAATPTPRGPCTGRPSATPSRSIAASW